MKDLQELIPIKENKINIFKIYYIELRYIYFNGSVDISDMDYYYSNEKQANEALEFLNNNESIPEGVKKIEKTVKHKVIAVYI